MRKKKKEDDKMVNLIAGVIMAALIVCGLWWCHSANKRYASADKQVLKIGKKMAIKADSFAFSTEKELKKAAQLERGAKGAAFEFFKVERAEGRAFYVAEGMEVMLLDYSAFSGTAQVQTSTGSRGWVAASILEPQ